MLDISKGLLENLTSKKECYFSMTSASGFASLEKVTESWVKVLS